MDFEIILIIVAGLIWLIQKGVEGARTIRRSSLTPEEKQALKQERLEARRAWKQQKASESVLFPSSRSPVTAPSQIPSALASTPPVVVPAPPRRHPPRLELGAEPEPLDRAEALQMLWKQAVGPKPPPVPPRSDPRRSVTDAITQSGYTHHAGFDWHLLRRSLASPSSLRTAILLQEILGPPKALRRR